jgi:hypothetical protein
VIGERRIGLHRIAAFRGPKLAVLAEVALNAARCRQLPQLAGHLNAIIAVRGYPS